MSNHGSNIAVLQDYLKARDLLKQGRIAEFLAKQRAELCDLDLVVLKLPSRKHKLKDVQVYKIAAAEIEHDLVIASNGLEAKIAEATDEKDKEAKRLLMKQCEKLSASLERVKKNIEADLADCRFEILKPLTIVGFLGGIPITSANLANLLTNNRTAILCAAIVGAATGISLVSRYHARTVIESAKATIVKSPRHFRLSKKSVRNSTFATALRLTVTLKQANEIEPRHPARLVNGSQMVIFAKR